MNTPINVSIDAKSGVGQFMFMFQPNFLLKIWGSKCDTNVFKAVASHLFFINTQEVFGSNILTCMKKIKMNFPSMGF
jgi:hypothetical protein